MKRSAKTELVMVTKEHLIIENHYARAVITRVNRPPQSYTEMINDRTSSVTREMRLKGIFLFVGIALIPGEVTMKPGVTSTVW